MYAEILFTIPDGHFADSDEFAEYLRKQFADIVDDNNGRVTFVITDSGDDF